MGPRHLVRPQVDPSAERTLDLITRDQTIKSYLTIVCGNMPKKKVTIIILRKVMRLRPFVSRLTVQPVEHTKTGLPPGLDSSALSISSKGTTPTS